MSPKGSLGFTLLLLSCPLLLLLQAGCRAPLPTAADLAGLQGKWEGVALRKETPGGPFAKLAETITVTVNGNSLHFHRDTNFWFETTVALPAGTDPKQLHATIRENAPAQGRHAIGKVVVALFKIQGGTLTLAAGGDGSEDAPKSFEDDNVTRYELRKVQPKEMPTQPLKPK